MEVGLLGMKPLCWFSDERELNERQDRAGEMAQWVKALPATPDDLCLIPETQVLREVTPESCPLSSICMPWHVFPPYTHKTNN